MWITLLLSGCLSDNGTVAPPGDPTRFDPVAQAAEVARFAGEGFQLTGMNLNGLRSDGTIDLTRPPGEAMVTYEGFREVPPPADAKPVGAGGSLDGRYWEEVRVELYEPGQWRTSKSSSGSRTWKHKGMEREGRVQPTRPTDTVLPMPACPLGTLFQALIAQGAPASAVAIGRYDERGWDLDVRDTPFSVTFDAACQPRK